MRLRKIWLAELAALLTVFCSIAAHANEPEFLTEAQAREEIDLVLARIKSEHPNPYWFHDARTWSKELAQIRHQRGSISSVDHYFNLSRLMALATDTHVQIYPNPNTPGFEKSFPLRFRLFSEGAYVVAADNPYRDWVGARIISIGRKPIEKVIAELSHYAFADHPLRKKSWAVDYLLPHPATYKHLGLMEKDGGVRITLEAPDGAISEARLLETSDASFDDVHASGASSGYYWPRNWRTLDDLIDGPPPLSRAHLDRNFWYADLENGRIGYLQLNVPEDPEEGETLLNFAMNTFAEIANRENRPERFILDIRHNLGGSIGRSLPYAYLARASGFCCDPGNFVVLIGRETISAGSILAGTAETGAYAVTIGEPTGGRPNLFLGHTATPLPHSHLEPQISSEIYIGTDSADRRLYVAPDIPVEESFASVMTGRDIALERAIAMTAEEAQSFFPGDTSVQPWTRPSQSAAQSSNTLFPRN
ncbi:MAG: hypothetical protein AB7F91_01165 [Parvularculaceae bacterium]